MFGYSEAGPTTIIFTGPQKTMAMIVSIPKEVVPGEQRVGLIPELVSKVARAGVEVRVEAGAGSAAGFADAAYQEKGAHLAASVWEEADIVLKVRPPIREEIDRIKQGAMLIGFLEPYGNTEGLQALAQRKVTAFAMELMPRITRAQSMDALSAMSTVAGYKAVLLAAARLPKFFPLLMTAAGTINPARVFIIGAGVAGLQAIATARRLGAVVEAYDTRPAVKEQVESLGARFLDLGLDTKTAEEKTGYARAQTEEFYQRQREKMARSLAGSDVVITTALVPGQKAPVLINEEMVQGMRAGSVIVDLAAEQGGNCALTEADREVVKNGVAILGPVNLPSTVPFHASQMYARTVSNYLNHLFKKSEIVLDLKDELTRAPLATHQGQVLFGAEGKK